MRNQIRKIQKGEWLPIIAIILVIAVFAGTITAVALASGPSTSPPKGPPPLPTSKVLPIPPKAQSSDLIPSFDDQPEINEITIAEKVVKLPADAKIAAVIGEILPLNTTEGCFGCDALEHLPIAVLKRGNSTIRIGIDTGKVIDGEIAFGEEAIFEFISDVLPDQSQMIKSLSARTQKSDPTAVSGGPAEFTDEVSK